uniref:G-protein coupled receptors family 3 profile domain-containing protein n=1 Tax=Onchocerca volvulus TaxID=6282 RepID=A0A2K6WL54_ONCVO
MAFVAVTLIISRYVWMDNAKLIVVFSFMLIVLIVQILNLICETFKCLRIRIAPIVTIVFHGISIVFSLVALIILIIVITKQENPETLCGPFKYSEVLIAAACYTLGSMLLPGALILIILFCQPSADFLPSLEKPFQHIS